MIDEEKRGAGRPRIIVDEDAILELASKGRILSEIASYCGVSVDTITRNYAELVKRGRSIMEGSLRNKQYEIAMTGNPTMLIWLGKQYLEQSDKSEINGNLKHEHADLSSLNSEQLDEVERIIQSADTKSS